MSVPDIVMISLFTWLCFVLLSRPNTDYINHWSPINDNITTDYLFVEALTCHHIQDKSSQNNMYSCLIHNRRLDKKCQLSINYEININDKLEINMYQYGLTIPCDNHLLDEFTLMKELSKLVSDILSTKACEYLILPVKPYSHSVNIHY